MRKVRSDTVAGQVLAEQSKKLAIPIPVWTDLDATDEETLALWEVYTSARDKALWREVDLLMLAQLTSFSLEIRRLTDQLKVEGYTIEGASGQKVNPALKVRDMLMGRKLSLIGKLSLGISSNRGRELNKAGEKAVSVTVSEGKTRLRVL